jgi:Cu(I)/Ag(I) efflux system protein CusF
MNNYRMSLALAVFAALSTATVIARPPPMDSHLPGMQHDAKAADAQGVGVVKAIDATRGTITLKHEAIQAIGWPAMTMTFKLASADSLGA